jgi:hypothetical protein
MYLVRTVWGWRAAWINVALASLVLAVVVGGATTARRIAQLRRGATAGLDQSTSQGGNALDPILLVSFVMRTAIFTGIVFLMTTKPGLEESLAGVGAAAALGVLSSVAISRAAIVRRERPRRRVSPEGIGSPRDPNEAITRKVPS